MQYDLTDLRLFLNVGEALNLTRAAERSFLSLPAASIRIKQLEEAFQTPLLIRQAKGVQLTQAGELLLRHTRQVFRQLECLHADLHPYAKGVKGRIRLLANTTATNTFLPEALSRFLGENPDIDIDLEEQPSRDIVSAVIRGIVDLGIVAGQVEGEGIEVLPLYADELVVIAPRGHDAIAGATISLAELLDSCRFVGLNQFNSIQSFLDRIAQGLGKRVNPRIQVGSFEAVCRMVEAGAGIAVIPRACLPRPLTPGLRVISLRDNWARREISLVRQRNHHLPQFTESLIGYLLAAATRQTASSQA